MRLTLLTLGLLFAACASPGENGRGIPPIPQEAATFGEDTGDFDAQTWLANVRALGDDYRETGTPEAEREQALANELDAHLDWRRACDTYPDYETGEPVYDPASEDVLTGSRGRLHVAPLSNTDALVAVTCYFGAYQGSYSLVRIAGSRATLLTAQALDETSRPARGTQTAFSELRLDDPASGTFQTFAKGRGLGDCGELVTYALASGDALEIREVRARECGDTIPDPLPPPTEWPVVYASE